MTVNSSDLDMEIAKTLSGGGKMMAGDGNRVIPRFQFRKEGKLANLCREYKKMEIPWLIHITDAGKDYTVDGTAVIRL